MLGGLDLKRFHHILIGVGGGPEKKTKIDAQPRSVKNHLHFQFLCQNTGKWKIYEHGNFQMSFWSPESFFLPGTWGIRICHLMCSFTTSYPEYPKNRNREINRDFLKYMKNRIFPFFQNIFLKKSRFISRFSHFHDNISKLHKNVYIPTCEVRD